MSDDEQPRELIIARWSDRFLAWLIDFLIISSVCLIVITSWFGTIDLEWNEVMLYSKGIDYLPGSILFFIYWMVLEYKKGQSVGKKIFCLKVVDLYGKKPSLISVAINSFGKAFLLPLDMIFGLIFTNQKRQRIFNRISDTIVIKIKDKEISEKITYQKD